MLPKNRACDFAMFVFPGNLPSSVQLAVCPLATFVGQIVKSDPPKPQSRAFDLSFDPNNHRHHKVSDHIHTVVSG